MAAISSDNIMKSPMDRRIYRFIKLHNGLSALLIHDPEIFSNVNVTEEDDFEDDDDEEESFEDDDIGVESSSRNRKNYNGDYEFMDEDEESLEEEDGGSLEEEDGGSKEKGTEVSVKKAAAAMCVAVGSFTDPNEAQGLAHFLEHMLFMGSSLFPGENEYSSYLTEHGGFYNACTDNDHTCYKFDVKAEFLKGALERFAQLFISPLIKGEAMQREISSVDSEFKKLLHDDSSRLHQLQCHTSAPGHPFRKFSYGNKKSLSNNAIDLREHMLKLFNDYYLGELMKLVVIGGESLDVLESLVIELFGNIKGSPVKPKTSLDRHIWNSGKIYKLKPVVDIHRLVLSWTLPSSQENYLRKTEEYFAYLLESEGKGSLSFLLKAKGWASSLKAGVRDQKWCQSSFNIFRIIIHLSDSGVEKISDIIGFVYQYLKLLRQISPQEWVFKELQDIGKLKFVLDEGQSQSDYAENLAGTFCKLHKYPPEHVIYGEYAFEIWDEKMIKAISELFKPRNMRVDVLTKSFNKSLGFCKKRKRKKILDIKLEPWFGSQYVEEDIPRASMQLWKNPPIIDSSLQLQSKNNLIQSDLSIRADEESCESPEISSPTRILDEPLMTWCYQLDKTTKLPLADIRLYITLNRGCSSLRNVLLTELFTLLLKDELSEIIYKATMAELQTSICLRHDQLVLKVYGFIEKLPVLLSEVCAIIKSFSPKDDRFRAIKEDLKRTLKNTNMMPLNHCCYSIKRVLHQGFWSVDKKRRMLSDLSLADLKAFIPELFSQLYIEGHFHGNLLEKDALDISNIFRSNFPVPSLPIEMRHKELVVCLSPSADLVRDVRVKNKLETNSVVLLYYQIGQNTLKLYMLTLLFCELVREAFFDELRTKEQLGYVVQCTAWVTYGILGLCFFVQSSEFNPVYLQERIVNFINGLEDKLNEMKIKLFENYKSGLMSSFPDMEQPFFVGENDVAGQRVGNSCKLNPDLIPMEEATEGFQKTPIIEWYNSYLRKPSPKCRRIAIRVWGYKDWKTIDPQPSSSRVIEDIEAFIKESDFYPGFCCATDPDFASDHEF